MTSDDKKHLEIVLRHIELVQQTGKILAYKLLEKGEDEKFVRRFLANLMTHDRSKLICEIEWKYLRAGAPKDLFKEALETHQNQNKHHTPYWLDIKRVPKIYLAELVCDVFARSSEMATDLKQWLDKSFLKEHKITKKHKVYQEIKYFIDLLLEDSFK